MAKGKLIEHILLRIDFFLNSAFGMTETARKKNTHFIQNDQRIRFMNNVNEL